jgi:hypothetical protein
MVSDPLNFKNPLQESDLETAKSRKDFAKKISSKRLNPGISEAFSEMGGEAGPAGVRPSP